MMIRLCGQGLRGLAVAVGLWAVTACDNGGQAGPGEDAGASLPTRLDGPGPEATDENGFAKGPLVYGRDDAPVTIIEFASWTCGHCGTFHREVFPEIKEKLVDTGKARFVMMDWPRQGFDLIVSSLARCDGPDAFPARAKLIFSMQSQWLNRQAPDELPKLMRVQTGMPRSKYDRCTSNQSLQTHLAEWGKELGEAFNIEYTPFIVVNGRELDLEPGRGQYEQIAEAVTAAQS